MKQCPNCGEDNTNSRHVCWECGTLLIPQAKDGDESDSLNKQSVSQTPNSINFEYPSISSHREMKRCPYCAEDIYAEAILCRYCGKELISSPQIDNVKVTKKDIEATRRVLRGESTPFKNPSCRRLLNIGLFGMATVYFIWELIASGDIDYLWAALVAGAITFFLYITIPKSTIQY